MKYNFDEVVDRRNTFSMKWNAGELLKSFGVTERFDKDTIPVFTADMDFRCAKPIQDALQKVVDHNIYGYTHHTACEHEEYFQVIINWFKENRQWEIKPEEIIYVNGTVEAVKLAILAFTNEGEGVLINRPIYTPFTGKILETNRVVVNSSLVNNDGYYTVDFEDFEKKVADENTKLMILCHPHNPTGRIWTDNELKKMTELCKKNNVIIIADEIHGDLVRKGQAFHPLETVVDYDGIVTCTAVNKTFNLAGLHATNVIIKNSQLREKFQKTASVILPNIFTISAVIAAYTEGKEWLNQVNEYIDGNIDWVLSFLKERMPKVKCFRPEGTYIMWMDFQEYGLTAEEIHKKIYIDANVVLEGGLMFDPENGAGFERICVPTSRKVIQEVFERIASQFE